MLLRDSQQHTMVNGLQCYAVVVVVLDGRFGLQSFICPCIIILCIVLHHRIGFYLYGPEFWESFVCIRYLTSSTVSECTAVSVENKTYINDIEEPDWMTYSCILINGVRVQEKNLTF